MITISTIVCTEKTFVVVLADLRGGIQGVSRATWQETSTSVTSYGIVAPLRWQTTILLYLTFVNIHASLSQILASEANFTVAGVTSHRIDTLLVAATSILYFSTLVNINTATISDKLGARNAFLVGRCWNGCCNRSSGDRLRNFGAAVTTWLVVTDLTFAGIQSFRTFVYVVANLIRGVVTITSWTKKRRIVIIWCCGFVFR